MAKIMMPDDPDEVVEEQIIDISTGRREHTNFIMAAAVGAQDGLKLAVNIAAMLIAFISLIALVNLILGGIGGIFGMDYISVEWLLGWAFAPLAWAIGIPWEEAKIAGSLFGQKIIINEFYAYAQLVGTDGLSPKSIAIITFALCGFANLSSIGILLGGLGSLIPDRMSHIADLGIKAVAAGSLSNLMSAALAGILISFGAG